MLIDTFDWKPGSFTKNFSWGRDRSHGLIELHNSIVRGFGDSQTDIPRDVFRQRSAEAGRPDFIPINFFLFNKIVNGVNVIIYDELVFQALNFPHSQRFDRLALFAFHFSHAGVWRGADPEQRYPALWARQYLLDRVIPVLNWDESKVDSNDIERYIISSPRYRAQGARKVATNLNYLYWLGRLGELPSDRIERWWVDAFFLALDRLVEDAQIEQRAYRDSDLSGALRESRFFDLSGGATFEKELATEHILRLYVACGRRARFSEEAVEQRAKLTIGDIEHFIANDPRPRGAVEPHNPRVVKSIPSACAMLARYAGWEDIDPDELESFDPDAFVERRMRDALRKLRESGVEPTMTAEELMRLTRGR